MEMKDRIQYIITQKGVTKTAFAKTAKVSQGFVSQICSGVSNPSDRTIELICQEYDVNEAWLRTGEGEPFKERSRQEEIMRFAVQTYKSGDEFRQAFVAMLSKLDPEDWQALNRIADKLLEEYKK